jgi:hypothetical protein
MSSTNTTNTKMTHSGKEIGTAFADALISRCTRFGRRVCNFKAVLTDTLELEVHMGEQEPWANHNNTSGGRRMKRLVEAYIRLDPIWIGNRVWVNTRQHASLLPQQQEQSLPLEQQLHEPKLMLCLNINEIKVRKEVRSQGVFTAAIGRLEEAAAAGDLGDLVLYVSSIGNDRLMAFLAARPGWRQDVSGGVPDRSFYYMHPGVARAPAIHFP